MRTSLRYGPIEALAARATTVSADDETLTVELSDGRTIAVPLLWFPRLAQGTPAERANWRMIADGTGIHWPELDEDISIAGLLEGRSSGESPRSFQKWLTARQSV